MACPENYTKWHPITGIQVEIVPGKLRKKVSNCTFSISIKEGTDIVDLAKRAITGAGGEFSGDQQGGTFTISTGIGKVVGNYTITDSSLNVSVNEKPIFISCGRIEKEIRKYLERT